MSRTILAVDPGKVTGVALLMIPDGDEPILLDTKELSVVEFAPYIRSKIEAGQGTVDLVCEKFTITMQTAKNSQAPWSLEQIGILKQICRDNEIDEDSITWQLPANAMTMFPNEKLKRLGYWHRGGDGHANDAIRHALLRAVGVGWVPRALLG